MNPWWLFLIIPVAVYVGFAICALLAAADRADWEQDQMRGRGKSK